MDIIDLSNECRAPEETSNRGGKVYLPPVYDPSSGLVHTFLGYADTELVHHSFKIQPMLCTCASVAFTDQAICVDDLTTPVTSSVVKKRRNQGILGNRTTLPPISPAGEPGNKASLRNSKDSISQYAASEKKLKEDLLVKSALKSFPSGGKLISSSSQKFLSRQQSSSYF
jgi:hypothetical protein